MSEHYAVVLNSDLESLTQEQIFSLFSSIKEDGPNTLRKSLDDSKAIIKWDGEENPCETLNIPHQLYTHEEILSLTNGSEWSEELI